MKQIDLFGGAFTKNDETEYTTKIKLPLYEPSNIRPNIFELCDKTKAQRLINEINGSNLPDEEKQFLRDAAMRHMVFNYQKIADYYTHASVEMQKLMEKSALIIIDFNKAFALGYINLAHELANQHFEHYGE